MKITLIMLEDYLFIILKTNKAKFPYLKEIKGSFNAFTVENEFV